VPAGASDGRRGSIVMQLLINNTNNNNNSGSNSNNINNRDDISRRFIIMILKVRRRRRQFDLLFHLCMYRMLFHLRDDAAATAFSSSFVFFFRAPQNVFVEHFCGPKLSAREKQSISVSK
jgi:hypothetical protein